MATTIIDQLIVELGLDPTKFDAGRKQAAQDLVKFKDDAVKNSKEIEGSAKKLIEAFNVVQARVLQLATLFTAGMGLKAFSEDTVRSGANLDRLSKQLNVSVNDLSAWYKAAQRAGGSGENVLGVIKNIVSDFQDFAISGKSDVLPVLRGLKDAFGDAAITTVDANNKIVDINKTLLDLSKWAAEQKDPNKAVAVLRRLGFDAPGISLMMKGDAELKKLLGTIKTTTALTEEEAAAAKKLEQSWAELLDTSDKLGKSIFFWLVKPLTAFVDIITKLVDLIRSNDAGIVGAVLGGLFGVAKGAAVGFALGGPIGAAIGGAAGGVAGAAAGGAAGSAAGTAAGMPSRPTGTWPSNKAPPFSTYGGIGSSSALPPEVRGLLDTIHGSESKYSNGMDPYRVIVGGKMQAPNFDDHPRTVGMRTVNGSSTAAGRYQFLASTWDDMVKKYGNMDGLDKNKSGGVSFSPANQDKMAWLLARDVYLKKTGRDLAADLKSPMNHARILSALSGTWTSLPGGIEPNGATGSRLGALGKNIDAHTKGWGDDAKPMLPMVPWAQNPAAIKPMSSTTHTSTNREVNINGINVYPLAADPRGQGRSVADAVLASDVYANNYGMSP